MTSSPSHLQAYMCALALLAVMGCNAGSAADDGQADETGASEAEDSSSTDASSSQEASGEAEGGDGDGDGDACGPDVEPPDEQLGAGSDPAAGQFTLEEALAELPEGPGPLRAELVTSLGTFTCELFPDEAPIGVANFIGLARGRRPWLDPTSNQWVRRPYYDGTIFHRVIPNFMIQGGDILGTGFGGPGYSFEDEFSALTHQPGTLSYANSGPDSNGSQFFITEVATDWLDGVHTVFGACTPVEGVEVVAGVPTDANDKPLEDVVLQHVEITRCEPDAS